MLFRGIKNDEQLQSILDSFPNYKSVAGANPYFASVLEISESDEIIFNRPVIIRKNKSIIIKSPAHSSAKINAPANQPCFIVEPGHRVAMLEGLTLYGGGVKYLDKVNKHWGMKNCTIIGANCGIEIDGQGSVGGHFDNIYFRSCVEDIRCLKGQNNLIVFDRCFFLQTTGKIGITLASTHFSFRNCSWERSSVFASIHLADNTEPPDKSSLASFSTFDNCRWGPENPTPNYIMVVGGKPYTLEYTNTNLYNIKISGDMRGFKNAALLRVSPNSQVEVNGSSNTRSL